MNVSNRTCIRRLALKTLTANRSRNLIATLAIALTALLFTALFTIALSVNAGIQQANFRQVGGFSHGGFKYLTQAQFDELKTDPLIREWGLRRFVGMPQDVPFNKAHVEVGFSDEKQAHWMFCDPVQGRLPAEGTMEAATDTHVLKLLGIEPKLGAEFTLTFPVDGHQTTQTFRLCGWWEYDEAIVANHVLIPQSRVDAILSETGVDPAATQDGMTGSWNLDVMLAGGEGRIEQDMEQILHNHGYQSENRGENFINTGVNWGYTGVQITKNLDPVTALGIVAVVLLIIFTGYLIIYNVFQISVAGDIRFYGLLKTIGTTPRQLRRIIRLQALALSGAGIPVGLLLGWLAGGGLTPVIVARLNGVVSTTSASPWIFAISAAFALLTVLLSCRRPGRMAGKVSPVEAVRYTEVSQNLRARGRRARKVSPVAMAWANMRRSRGKTAVTMVSLSLAVVLLTATVNITGGFDMDKYVSNFTASDFIVASAGQFQTGGTIYREEKALPEEAIAAVTAQGGITGGGRIYGKTSRVQEFVTEEYFRHAKGWFNTQEELDSLIAFCERRDDGLLADSAQLYGMESFALDRLHVLEGDLSALYTPGSRAIAAIYGEDEAGNVEPETHWAKLGDTVTLRHVQAVEYFNPVTGEVYGDWASVPPGANWAERAIQYRDIDYTVAALVAVPYALSYRYYGNDEFVLNAQTFIRDTGTNNVMYYAFDTTIEANAAMESFLKDYTNDVNPELDYESKATYAAEFESTRTMFALCGGALSFIVGLVGVLNFFNAILTSIIARRRELAVLEAVGMTGKQMRAMLMGEGLLYALGAVGLALVLTLVLGPVAFRAIEGLFWFFTYRPSFMPLLLILPLFILLGAGIPVLTGRAMRKSTVVERLRME